MLLVCVASVGCARVAGQGPSPAQTLQIDGEGRATSLEHGEPLDPQVAIAPILAGIEREMNLLPPDQPALKVLIYIHGGMKPPARARRQAVEMLPRMQAAGYYSIVINWDSSLMSSYTDHLLRIRQGRSWPWLGLVTSPFVLLGDVGSSLARLPMDTLYLCGSAAQSFYVANGGFSRRLMHQRSVAEAAFESLAAEGRTRVNRPREQRSVWRALGTRSAYILTLPAKIIVTPVLDGAGSNAWRVLQRRVGNLFTAPAQLEERPARAQPGGVAALMQALTEAAPRLEDQHGRRLQFTLIGHSMGTLVLNQIICRYPELDYREIVYMAAAGSTREFVECVVPYLRAHADGPNPARFYNLMLHPAAEVRERWSHPALLGLDLPPRGSVLVWIDDLLAAPASIPERSMGQFINVMPCIATFPKEILPNLTFKTFNAGTPGRARQEGLRSSETANPERHREFNDAPFWESAFWEVP